MSFSPLEYCEADKNSWSINLIPRSLEDVKKMPDRNFEQLINIVLLHHITGAVGKVSKPGKDGGVDIDIEYTIVGELSHRVIVQAKRWKTGNVGNDVVLKTIGAMTATGAQSAIIVTTATFTRSAIEAAKRARVTLLDGEAFWRLLTEVPSYREMAERAPEEPTQIESQSPAFRTEFEEDCFQLFGLQLEQVRTLEGFGVFHVADFNFISRQQLQAIDDWRERHLTAKQKRRMNKNLARVMRESKEEHAAVLERIRTSLKEAKTIQECLEIIGIPRSAKKLFFGKEIPALGFDEDELASEICHCSDKDLALMIENIRSPSISERVVEAISALTGKDTGKLTGSVLLVDPSMDLPTVMSNLNPKIKTLSLSKGFFRLGQKALEINRDNIEIKGHGIGVSFVEGYIRIRGCGVKLHRFTLTNQQGHCGITMGSTSAIVDLEFGCDRKENDGLSPLSSTPYSRDQNVDTFLYRPLQDADEVGASNQVEVPEKTHCTENDDSVDLDEAPNRSSNASDEPLTAEATALIPLQEVSLNAGNVKDSLENSPDLRKRSKEKRKMEHSEDSVQNITYTTEKEMSVKCIALQCNVDVEDLIRWNVKEYPDLKPSDKFKANTVVYISEEYESAIVQVGDSVTFRYHYYWEPTLQQKNEMRCGYVEIIKEKIKMHSLVWTENGNILENVKFSYLANNEIMAFEDKPSQQKFLTNVDSMLFVPTEESIDLPIGTFVCGIYGYRQEADNTKTPLYLGGVITEQKPSIMKNMAKIRFCKDLFHKDEFWYSWEDMSALRSASSPKKKRSKRT